MLKVLSLNVNKAIGINFVLLFIIITFFCSEFRFLKGEFYMDPIVSDILTSLAVNYFSSFSETKVKDFFNKAIKEKPEIEDQLKHAKSSYDFEEIFKEATGVIALNANDDEIKVFGGLLEALRGIKFDHGDGKVEIQGSVLNAPVLVTGGTVKSSGSTFIGENTELKSSGTSITLGKGSSISLDGNSSISQN